MNDFEKWFLQKTKRKYNYNNMADHLMLLTWVEAQTASAARIAELEAEVAIQQEENDNLATATQNVIEERDEIYEALLIQNSTIVDLGTRNIELEADCKAMVEALKTLMDWQLKNVAKWNNPAYDSAARVLNKIAAKYREGK